MRGRNLTSVKNYLAISPISDKNVDCSDRRWVWLLSP